MATRQVWLQGLALVALALLTACSSIPGPAVTETAAAAETRVAAQIRTQVSQENDLMATNVAATVAALPSDTPLPTSTSTAMPDAAATVLLTNVDEGYYFRFPVAYHAVVYGSSLCLSLVSGHGPPGPCHSASAVIDVRHSAGRSATQVADALTADALAVIPGISIERASLTIGDEEAIMLEGLPGVSSSRNVVIVHANRLYTPIFMPWDKTQGQEYTQLESLYATVINSFNFLSKD